MENTVHKTNGKPFVPNLPAITEDQKRKRKTCIKRLKYFLKFVSVAPLDNGLYFRRKQ